MSTTGRLARSVTSLRRLVESVISPRQLGLSIAYPLEAAAHALLAGLAAVVPFRDEDLWVFGAREGAGFADNPKYCFLHVVREHPEIRAVWLSRDPSVVRDLQSRGHEAHHVWSPRGVWLTLGAGVAVLSHSTRDVNRWFVGGATLAMLWHGVPLKAVAWDAELPELPLPARVGLRSIIDRYHLVTVPGPGAIDPLASGLGLDRKRFVLAGYPRNDALLGAFPEEEPVVDTDALRRIRRLGAGDRSVVVYLPTFRERGTRASDQLPVDELEAALADLDAVLVVKLHPSEELDAAAHDGAAVADSTVEPAVTDGADESADDDGADKSAVANGDDESADEATVADDADESAADGRSTARNGRIHALPSDVDVYPLLAEADALVTDYSSVFFDSLLLDRPIVFFPFDRDRYEATRGFYFDYDAVTPGPVARTDAELAAALRGALADDRYAADRAALRERFVRSGEPGTRSEAVVRAIRDRQRRQ